MAEHVLDQAPTSPFVGILVDEGRCGYLDVVSRPIVEAVDAAWSALGDRTSLMPDLELDAVLARADGGELAAAAPRLLELALSGRLGREPLHEAIGRLNPLLTGRGAARDLVLDVLDAWWATTLALDPADEESTQAAAEAALGVGWSAETVLGALVQLDEPLVRWLEPWLGDLNGPPARHLAACIRSELSSDAWQLVPDKRRQVLAWAASEPVVFGLTLVGGMHLDEGELGDLLDRLV